MSVDHDPGDEDDGSDFRLVLAEFERRGREAREALRAFGLLPPLPPRVTDSPRR